MKKLQVIENRIIWVIYDGDRYASNTPSHIVLHVRNLNEEIIRASAKLYERFRYHDNPVIATLGDYDIHMHYSYIRPKQVFY
jgi:Icc-related predicted phosphoesterase